MHTKELVLKGTKVALTLIIATEKRYNYNYVFE